MSKLLDTIAAIATPPGQGGIGIIRISGSMIPVISKSILGKIPSPRRAEYLTFYDNKNFILDQGIVLFFPSPLSFTGEDVLELQGHGSPVILNLLLQYITSFPNVRIAKPGEFSERAFLNGKLDLIQVESIANLINSNSIKAAKSAINSLRGVFSKKITKILNIFTKLRTYVEASIDFPDESIGSSLCKKIESILDDLIISTNEIYSEAYQGSLLSQEKLKIVIIGKPNTGKSSILNALVEYDAAIVTDIAGTTRDVLNEYINLNGISVHIMDTAGLRDTNDKIEKIGIERTYNKIKQADHILYVIDDKFSPSFDEFKLLHPMIFSYLSNKNLVTIIQNKADITGNKIGMNQLNGYTIITVSAKNNQGIDKLRMYLTEKISFLNDYEGIFLANQRHLDALRKTSMYLLQCKKLLEPFEIELLAEELRLAQLSLNEIIGKFTSNDLLNEIFSNFCIGK